MMPRLFAAAGGGGGGGGGGIGIGMAPSSLVDAYANVTMADALGRTREGISDPAKVHGYPHVRLPAIGQANQVHRWDPWVRNYVLQMELLGHGLGFQRYLNKGLTLTINGRALITLVRPSKGRFASEIDDVLSFAALRQDRATEILSQIDGQWPFWGALLPARLASIPYVQEIMTAITQMAVFVEMRFKNDFACPRPIEWSAQVQPMITTPGHGTFPMGHSTQIYAVVSILKRLIRDGLGHLPSDLETQMDRLARRMSENRIVAGVHFPVDLYGGTALGLVLGRYAFERFTEASITTREDPIVDLNAASSPQALASQWIAAFDSESAWSADAKNAVALERFSVGSPTLRATWDRAVAEVRFALNAPSRRR